MEIVQSIYEFFGFDLINQSATITDVFNNIIQVGVGVWVVLFVCKCLFYACTLGERRLF